MFYNFYYFLEDLDTIVISFSMPTMYPVCSVQVTRVWMWNIFNIVLRKLRSSDLKVCVLTAWDHTLLALIKVFGSANF